MVVVPGGGAAVVTLDFTAVTAEVVCDLAVVTVAVVSNLAVVVGDMEVVGNIDDFDVEEKVVCMGLTVVEDGTVVVLVVVVVVAVAVVEVVMEAVVVLDGCEVAVVVGLLAIEVLDARGTEVGAVGVMDEDFAEIGVVIADAE